VLDAGFSWTADRKSNICAEDGSGMLKAQTRRVKLALPKDTHTLTHTTTHASHTLNTPKKQKAINFNVTKKETHHPNSGFKKLFRRLRPLFKVAS